MPPPLSRLARFVLGWNILVILWGAVVRATGSGAGCGAHWPTCNGSVVPLDPSMETLIEFSHRATSGLALLLVAALVRAIFVHRPRGHLARFWSAASLLLILSEAAIGAGLVLLEKVARDASLARGAWVSGHLVNTFLLLAALALTAHFVDAREATAPAGLGPALRATFPLASRASASIPTVAALLATGISGAIAALGDTLFKAGSLSEAMAQDFSSSSHLFLRLRILHPVIALLGGGLVLWLAYRGAIASSTEPATRKRALLLGGLVLAQWLLGVVNLVLLAPTWLQIIHLLVADLIWIGLILTLADAGPRRAG